MQSNGKHFDIVSLSPKIEHAHFYGPAVLLLGTYAQEKLGGGGGGDMCRRRLVQLYL